MDFMDSGRARQGCRVSSAGGPGWCALPLPGSAVEGQFIGERLKKTEVRSALPLLPARSRREQATGSAFDPRQ